MEYLRNDFRNPEKTRPPKAVKDRQSLPEGHHPDARPPGAKPPQRILVVDDDPWILQFSSEVLIHQGYEVAAAGDGEAGWEALNAASYSLLITDNNMPKLSGVEFVKRVRAAGMDLPIIMATGQSPPPEFFQTPWLQPVAVLLKPYTLGEMTNTVKRMMSEAEGAQRLEQLDLKHDRISPADQPPNLPRQSPPNFFHRILVVDDDDESRQFSTALLAGSGYDVAGVTDGAAGWGGASGRQLQPHHY